MNKLEKIRHSCSHILAYAVKELFPNVKLGIGPAIEDGFYYDFDKENGFSQEELIKIEKKMREIIKQDIKFKKRIVSKKEAEKIFSNEIYKLDLLKELKEVSVYESGKFIDLCKGPHVKSSKEIKAFKLLNTAGAYWKGDSKNKQLCRIYGTAFETEKELNDYLERLEEIKKRDHRIIGKQLDLFSFHEEGPGFVFWHPKGMIILNEILNFWKKEHYKRGYKEIITPIILNKELWLRSGHWDHYKENMYFTKVDEREYAVKPMNCPGGILIYKEKLHSYRELPLKIAELGLVHRHELSGVLAGLFRVRSFTQDDAHIYCLEKQIKKEVNDIIEFVVYMYKVFGFKQYHVELSTMPKEHIGDEKTWKKAEKIMKQVLKESKIKYKINEGDGAFYGPKIDFHIKDCIGRNWQCGTIQLDFAMPERFDLTYEGEDGKKHRIVMIHRTLLGSLERFIGILIENYKGLLPLWLSPVQVKILTVTDRSNKFALEIMKKLESMGVRVELDDRMESTAKKVRDAEMEKVNYIVNIGDKEIKSKTLAVRSKNKVNFGVKTESFVKDVLDEINKKTC